MSGQTIQFDPNRMAQERRAKAATDADLHDQMIDLELELIAVLDKMFALVNTGASGLTGKSSPHFLIAGTAVRNLISITREATTTMHKAVAAAAYDLYRKAEGTL
jgi:hypothetical protein